MSDLLALSPIDSTAPLPELIARQWNFSLQIQEVDGKDIYAIQDWVRGVMQKSEVRSDWKHLQKRSPELLKSVQQFPYKAANGRTYQMDYTDAGGLYAITQRMSSNTGIRNAVLDFLAKAGVKMDEYRLDPAKAVTDAATTYQKQGKSDQWVDARLQGVMTRKQFTDALRDVVAGIDGSFYGQSTEAIYKGLWDRTTAQLRGDLALTKHQNPRDQFGQYALIYTRLAESIATDRLREHDTVSRAMAAEIIHSVATLIKTQAEATSKALGVDLVTGARLLKAGR